MTDWTQLEKDLEALDRDPMAITRLHAPDLAALALAGRDAVAALEVMRDEIRMRGGLARYEATKAADAAITAFRKAEGGSHE
ncbi:hypothetical protein [Roseovarius sp.]|uniref:hypothetical protein n=1 Tax=Roseovarius sp. TaxID=1486281 RepID=UPI003BAAA492